LTSRRDASSSPNKPEIISVSDVSVIISNPAHQNFASNAQVEKKSRRKNSISVRNKHEVKMSHAASLAKAEFMRKHTSAIKIQRFYRFYLAR